jgi:hypothetical protein
MMRLSGEQVKHWDEIAMRRMKKEGWTDAELAEWRKNPARKRNAVKRPAKYMKDLHRRQTEAIEKALVELRERWAKQKNPLTATQIAILRELNDLENRPYTGYTARRISALKTKLQRSKNPVPAALARFAASVAAGYVGAKAAKKNSSNPRSLSGAMAKRVLERRPGKAQSRKAGAKKSYRAPAGKASRMANPKSWDKAYNTKAEAIAAAKRSSLRLHMALGIHECRNEKRKQKWFIITPHRTTMGVEVARVMNGKLVSENPKHASPKARKVYAMFHGTKPRKKTIYKATRARLPGKDFAKIGDLISLTVGNHKVSFDKDKVAPIVVTDAKAQKLFLLGGNQNLSALKPVKKANPGGLHDMGELSQIEYYSRKKFDDFRPTIYFHDLGEENGVRPRLMYDPKARQMYIAGGDYKIKPEGIVN